MPIPIVVYIFVMGLCVGSFVNVLIWRTLHGMSPYRGRSICDHCKRQLGWYENLPVVSYLALGGRCRTCKKKIDPSYPLVELVTGILFLWWATLGFAFFKLTQSPLGFIQPGFWLLVGLVLVIITFADLLHGFIPDSTLLVLGGLTLIYRVILISTQVMQREDFVLAIITAIGLCGFYLLLHLGTRGRGMGFGDVKFALIIGLILGFPKAVVATFLAFVIGGMFGMVVLVLGKKKIGQTVPFGPFMVLGVVLALLWGEQWWSWYVGYLGL